MNDAEAFEKALDFTLQWEGGYVNDPDDPGGETKFGISKRYHPDEDIKNLTRERAAEIYYDEYWYAAGCDLLPFPASAIVFDTAVNLGVNRAVEILRQANLDSDKLVSLRMAYYKEKVLEEPRKAKYLRGWTNRCIALLETFDEDR